MKMVAQIPDMKIPAPWTLRGAAVAQPDNRKTYERKANEYVTVMALPNGFRVLAQKAKKVLYHEDVAGPQDAQKTAIRFMKEYDILNQRWGMLLESALSFGEKRQLQKTVREGVTALRGKLSFAEKRAKQKEVSTGVSTLQGKAPAKVEPQVNTRDTFIKRDLPVLKEFMGTSQIEAVAQGIRGEEGQFFLDKMAELAERIRTMPKVYGQDGLGDKAKVFLHYFKNSSDWYITEKDSEAEQLQAFGYAVLNGDKQNAELGYISIKELLKYGVELDFYFEPKTLGSLKGKGEEDSKENALKEEARKAAEKAAEEVGGKLGQWGKMNGDSDFWDEAKLTVDGSALEIKISNRSDVTVYNPSSSAPAGAAVVELAKGGTVADIVAAIRRHLPPKQDPRITDLLSGKHNDKTPAQFLALFQEAAEITGEVKSLIPAAISYIEANEGDIILESITAMLCGAA